MANINLYFSGDQDEANELLARLNAIFGRLGYGGGADASPAHRGALAEALQALDVGEVAVFIAPEAAIIEHLDGLAREIEQRARSFAALGEAEAISAIADAIRAAQIRSIGLHVLSDVERIRAGHTVPCGVCDQPVEPGSGWMPGIYGEVICKQCQEEAP